MTTEEKAKAYDEAIEVAQRFYNNSVAITKKGLEDIFPELKESEDERMIKKIIATIHLYYGEPLEDEAKEMIAWLEKQKVLTTEEDLQGKEDVLWCIKQAKKHAKDENEMGTCWFAEKWLEKQGEKPVNRLKITAGNWYVCDMEVMNENMITAFHRGEVYYCPKDGYIDVNGMLCEVGTLDVFRLATKEEIPQQKQEWSEEDEIMFRKAIITIDNVRMDTNSQEYYQGICNWLKSLKDRVQPQPKQEWSDVDKDILFRTIDNLKFLKDTISTDPKYAVNIIDIEREITWLKSLRPQNTWKPSDLPHWKKSTLPDNTTGFNSDYFCYKGYNINYKELFEKLPKDN